MYWFRGFSLRFQSSCCSFFCDTQGSLVPLLNQLLNPNLQVLRSWLVHHDMFYMGPVVLRHRVGWLVVWLAGWLCESARCKLDNSSNSWDVFIASEDETRIERYSFTISSPPFWKWSPSLVLALNFLSYCSCLNSYTNCNVWNPSKPCKNKRTDYLKPQENPVKPIETHQVVFPRFPASQPTTWQDPMLFERLLSKIFLVDVSGCNTYRQWDVCLHTNKKSHSFLWNPPVDYCKTLDI